MITIPFILLLTFYSSSEAFDDCRYSCFELFLCHVLEPDGEIILTDIESIKSL